MLSSNQSPEANALERYYCAANVHFDGGVQDDNLKEMWLSPEEKLTYEVRIGDLLVVEGGAGAGGSAIVKKQDGKVYMQNSILRLRPGDSADNRYLVYWIERLVKSDYMGLVCNKATIPHFTKQKLGFTQMPLPPLAEQRRIADKLDKICGIVDELRANIEKEIAALGEYRKSLITRCVTKGIPAERGRRPRRLKPSGVDWIGDVPEGWNVEKIKLHYAIKTGNGFAVELQGCEKGDFPVCKASDISPSGQMLDNAANWISRTTAGEYGFNVLPPQSVIFPKVGEAMKKNSRKLTSLCCCLDNNCQGVYSCDVYPAYSYYVFSLIDMGLFDNHGPIPCVNNLKLKNSFVPVPPLDEQREIAAYLDRQCAAIDAKVAERTRQLGKLAEYRKSVIYEYVTGKKVA